eukprot:GHRR01005344.1.p1 GENE.GHRR01005344.1~~GHRR01005344.1.p1  ORF type:complete len:226 (+),score=72.48 GHRR01005344.1:1165-1842(+)
MDTFQRLNLGLLLQCGTCLAVLLQAVSLRNPVLTAYVGGICGFGVVVTSTIYRLHKQGFPFPSPIKTLAGAISVLLPRNTAAAAYSLMTIVFAAMAFTSLSSSPGDNLALYDGLMGPMTVFMQRVMGAGLLLMAIVAYSLKDGADREKLGATTFRWLNLGVAGTLLARIMHMTLDWQSGLLQPGPRTAAVITAHLAAFAWTSHQYTAGTSKPKPEPLAPAPGTAS